MDLSIKKVSDNNIARLFRDDVCDFAISERSMTVSRHRSRFNDKETVWFCCDEDVVLCFWLQPILFGDLSNIIDGVVIFVLFTGVF